MCNDLFCHYRFIQTFGTHIIVGVTMGGKDVLYVKQRRSSSFVSSVFARMEMRKIANKKFSENNGRNRIDSEQVELNNEVLIRLSNATVFAL